MSRVEVLPALRRQRDAHRQQGPLAALARGQLGGAARGAGAAPRRRSAGCARVGPPLSGCAATTRPITIAGSRSSRSATRRTRSSRLAVSPIPARIGATSLERPVALGRRGGVGAVEHQPDLEGGQLDRAVDQRPEALGAALGRPSSRPGPRPPASPRPAAASCRPPATRCARSIASCPAESASSASTTSSTMPESVATCSLGDRRAHHRDRLLDPGLVQGEHVGVALDDDRPPGLGDRRLARRSMP